MAYDYLAILLQSADDDESALGKKGWTMARYKPRHATVARRVHERTEMGRLRRVQPEATRADPPNALLGPAWA